MSALAALKGVFLFELFGGLACGGFESFSVSEQALSGFGPFGFDAEQSQCGDETGGNLKQVGGGGFEILRFGGIGEYGGSLPVSSWSTRASRASSPPMAAAALRSTPAGPLITLKRAPATLDTPDFCTARRSAASSRPAT